MTAKTRNNDISVTATDSTEIPMANSRFSTITRWTKMQQSDCDNVGQSKWQDWHPKRLYCHFQLNVVVAITW